jgi:hypothetical protein
MQKPPKKAFLEILAVIENGLSQALQNLNNLKKVVTLDRQNIRETLADLKSELNKVPIKESDDLHKLTDQILSIINKIQRALRNLGDSSPVPFKPGWDALGELQKLGDEMDRIYGKKVIPAAEIDETLKRIDAAMKQFTAIVEKPDFMAADITIKGIRSKISYIKRSQKNSPVRLTDFRKAYSGTTNLLSREYSLRNEINDLKNRIDRDYIPYIEILAKIRQFPARQLVFKVTNAACWLRAVNTAGFDSAGALLAEKDKLYSLLREIREHAHLLLQGSIEDIHFRISSA